MKLLSALSCALVLASPVLAAKPKVVKFSSPYPKYLTVKATCLDFGPTPLGKAATAVQMKLMDEVMSNAIEGVKESLKEKPFPISFPWTVEGETIVYTHTSKIISYEINNYSYTGGAHGSPLMRGETFFVDAKGTARKALATDLVPGLYGLDYLKDVVSSILMAEHPEGPWWEESGPRLDNSNLSSFCVDKKGVTFLFEHYVLGAYAVGSFEAMVPWDRLGKRANKALMPH